MSASIYLDDAHANPALSEEIRLYASLLAVTHLNMPAHLTGQPPVYTPTNPSPLSFTEYLNLCTYYQQRLADALQNSPVTQ